MTAFEIILWTCGYLVLLIAVIYLTRARTRRVGGAVAGGAAAGLYAMGVIALSKKMGWWQIPFEPTAYFVPFFYVGLSITLMPICLVTWRLTRRFGWRGLAAFVCIAGVVGPPRDYMYAAMFPKWMVFAPGAAPIFANAAAYIGIVIVGHAVMRLVAGPAREDLLARN